MPQKLYRLLYLFFTTPSEKSSKFLSKIAKLYHFFTSFVFAGGKVLQISSIVTIYILKGILGCKLYRFLPIFTATAKLFHSSKRCPSGAEQIGGYVLKGGLNPDKWPVLADFGTSFFVRKGIYILLRLFGLGSHRLPLQANRTRKTLPPTAIYPATWPVGDDQT